MRGKGILSSVATVRTGITPAYAGKRKLLWRTNSSLWDHPRVCGEKVQNEHHHVNCLGSPPRVRGKDSRQDLNLQPAGITPACAGKSPTAVPQAECCRDHPRVCGEKIWPVPHRPAITGSPPRVRGKGPAERSIGRQPRITPACAGKSACSSSYDVPLWDHPRVCGEKCR